MISPAKRKANLSCPFFCRFLLFLFLLPPPSRPRRLPLIPALPVCPSLSSYSTARVPLVGRLFPRDLSPTRTSSRAGQPVKFHARSRKIEARYRVTLFHEPRRNTLTEFPRIRLAARRGGEHQGCLSEAVGNSCSFSSIFFLDFRGWEVSRSATDSSGKVGEDERVLLPVPFRPGASRPCRVGRVNSTAALLMPCCSD